MKKETGVKRVREDRVGILYSLSKVLALVGTNRFCYLSEFLKNQNRRESLGSPFSSYKPFIRLFDLRLFSSIFLRNLRDSVRGDNIAALEILMVLAIPISMHCLIEKSSIQTGSIDLAKLIDGGSRTIEEPAIDSFQFSYSVPPSIRSLYVGKDGKKETYHDYNSALNKDIFAGLEKKKQQVLTDNVKDPLISDGWKIWITKGPSSGLSGDMMKKTQVRVLDKNLEDFQGFFEFYKNFKHFAEGRGNDCVFSYTKQISDSWEIQRDFRYFLPNSPPWLGDSVSPSVAGVTEKGSNRNLYPSQNLKWFLQSLEFNSHENGRKSPISQTYSQTRNKLIDRLIGFILLFKKSDPIPNRVRGIDQNGEKSGKAFRRKENLSFNTILWRIFGFQSSKCVDLKKSFSKNCKIFLSIPGGITDGNKYNTTCLIRLRERGSIRLLYPLVRWYERKKLISLCSIYTLLLYDNFCALANECFSRIQYQLDGWAGSTGVAGITIGKRLLGWRGNAERSLIKRILFRIDEYMDVQSNVYGWLNTTRDLSFLSSGRVLVGINYDLDTSIRGISIWRNRFLTSRIGTTIETTTGRYEKYSHQYTKYTNVSFIYKYIFSFSKVIICREALRDTTDYLVDKLNDMDNPLIDFLFSSIDIDKKVSVLKRIIKGKDHLLIDPNLLVNEGFIGSSILLKHAVDPLPVGSSGIKSVQTGFSNDPLSFTGKQNWNLFLRNWSRRRGSKGGIERHVLDRVTTRDFLNRSQFFLLNRVERDSSPKFRIGRDFLIKRYGGSYSNFSDDFCVGYGHPVSSYFGIGFSGNERVVSSIQSQVSDSLLPNNSQRTEGETNDYILTTIQSTPSDSDRSIIFSFLTHSDSHFNSILNLKRLLSKPSSFPREMRDFSFFSHNGDNISLKQTLVNDKLSTDWQSQFYTKNLGLGQVNSNKSIEGGSSSVNGFIGNRLDRNKSFIRSFWELREVETLYRSRRLSLFRIGGASKNLTGLLEKEVLHKDTKLVDPTMQEEPIRTSHPIDLGKLLNDLNEYKMSWIYWKDNVLENWRLFEEYIPWFFTPTWWRYFYDLLENTYPEMVLKISDDFDYRIPGIVKRTREVINGARSYLLKRLALRFKNDSIIDILSKIDLFIVEEITNQTKVSYSYPGWSIFKFSNMSIPSQLTLSILFVPASSKSFWPVISGFNSLSLWKRFATIGYSIDPMRRAYLETLMYSPSTGQMGTRDLLIHPLKRFLNYINNILFYSLVKNELDSWMLRRESSDTLRVNKELLTQYLVTNKTIFKYGSKLNFHLLSSELNYGPSSQEGSSLLSYLHQIRRNNLWNYKIRKSDSAEKWVLSAPERNILFSATMRQKGILQMPYRDIPISLQSGLLSSEGISLIGPMETGRSYLIRDIASDSYFPLVKLPIPKLLHNRSYFNNARGNFISKESVYRVSLISEMAKEMSPRVIWIQDIHQLNAHRSYHKLEADPRFLPCLILRSIQNERRNSCIRNNLVIASTHVPAEVDPALIAPNRLNQLINLRRSNRCQRQKELSSLLRVKGFDIQADPSLLEGTGFGTTGYSKRDLFFFAHEALLIGTFKRKKIVCSNAIELALHRQHSTVTHMGNGIKYSSEYEIFSHRIGKAIPKNSFIDTFPTDPFWIGRNTLKKRFYHLSTWYLESSMTESTITELTLFPHILGLLAGLAARDSWFEMDIRGGDNPIVIDKILENDFHLACGLLENLFRDFSCPEICRNNSQSGNGLFFPSPTEPGYYSDMIYTSCSSQSTEKQGLSNIQTDFGMKQPSETDSIPKEISREMTWSPKVWHFSFMRSGTYESIRVLSEFDDWDSLILLHPNGHRIPQRDFEWDSGKDSQFDSYDKRGYLFSYTRTLNKLRQKQTKRLEDRLETTSLGEQFLELGISDSSNSYETQWNRFNEPVLFVGGRFIWDPMLLFQPDSNFPPPHRNFLAKQELVRRPYVTYGLRREREKHFSNGRIKNLFLYRGYDRKSITTELSTKRLDNAPLDERRNSEYVKETWFMHTYLQYPLVSLPVHLYQNIVVEDLKERFVRLKLLVHRDRWMKRNRSQFKDFILYNMLFESYQYLFNPFWFDRTSLDRKRKRLLNGRPFLYKKLLHIVLSSPDL
uniref:conserved hypothetical protein Ycf2 n=1 Tax=Anemia phyllitidis TaxID=12940 RepID=UPI0021ACF559|nr:conserved hypothetical protein Ycf2 [Anemia phyllitidis]YP_010463869.1 conserved hypothetical protein Ycf2 [Anemia phyllitidis]UUL71119.1 conserved hypothetical protein Ycf2 [Anemia phyllitidis]UUL71135.1 conserved hypothetical protein Ycf2 [Anemia phyllitidis]